VDNNLTDRRTTTGNSTYKKLAAQFTADTFVVNQTLVLRIKFCGENRQLLVAAKRYAQALGHAHRTNVSDSTFHLGKIRSSSF